MDREATHRSTSLLQRPRLRVSVRTRLLLLILLAIGPALGLALYAGLQHRRMAAVQAQQEALRLARIAVGDHERLIHGAQQLLIVLSSLPVVRAHDARACDAYLAALLKQYPRYANLGMVTPDGDVVCSALPLPGPINLADRAYVRRAVETRDFAVGDYQIGRITGKATIDFGYPVVSDTGEIETVVFAALDLAWFSRLVTDAQLPPDSVLAVIDRNGTILARYPNPEKWVGQSASGMPIVKTVLARGEGVLEAPGLDGISRLYGFTPCVSAPHGPGMYVWIGIPGSVAYAEANRILARSLIELGLAGALTIVAAWVFGDLFILRGVRALVHGTERLKAGDMASRVQVTGRDELSALATSFNDMADRLQAAYSQLTAHVKELTHRERELSLLREIDQAMLAETPLQNLLSKAVEAFTRLADSQTCVLVTADPESGELKPVANWGPDPEAIRRYFATLRPRVGEEGGCLGRAIATREAVTSPDVACDPSMERYRDAVLTLGIRAVLAVPLLTDQQVLGAAGIGYPTVRRFSETEVRSMEGFANQLAVALEQARLREEAKDHRRLEEALHASRQLFQAVVQSATDAVIVADGSSRIVACNAGAQRLFGYTEAELLGMSVMTLVPERYREAHRQGLERLEATGEAPVIGRTIEVDALRKDGSDVPVELSLAGWKTGDRVFYSAIVHDITERKQYTTHLEQTVQEKTRTLRATNQRLEAASRHKSEFLANMSHEFRTPLNSIIGFSDILRDPAFGPLTEKQARFAQNILSSGQHLLSLINDLLDLSKVEAGKIDLRPEPFECQEAIRAAMAEIQPQADLKQLEVTPQTDEAPSTIIADPVRFKQILLNLLSNAVKFTPEGGRITVTARRAARQEAESRRQETEGRTWNLSTLHPGDFVEIAVADTGIGMKPDDLPRLFQKFTRLDAAVAQRTKGTGLGLALTKRLVELHGGEIAAASDGEGQGSTFTVRLPMTPADHYAL
ncbi:MAG TPA: PAS domain S-box protein [Verrucomicrobiae bacterium]|nr:PAS domain S-box protein [Verrucomicrobiae bacterium]